jgi:2,2-dialkylglycine decarboxylase (pyruvate)
MGQADIERDAAFWARAERHMLRYGADFAAFVPARAQGVFLYDATGRRMLDLRPAR